MHMQLILRGHQARNPFLDQHESALGTEVLSLGRSLVPYRIGSAEVLDSPTVMSSILAAGLHRRLVVLSLLLLVSAALYRWLSAVAPPSDDNPLLFLPVWSICFLPYFLACAYVLMSRPTGGRGHWIELGVLVLGAFLFRLMLVPLPPGLSRDV